MIVIESAILCALLGHVSLRKLYHEDHDSATNFGRVAYLQG